jgi:hypothetical protein
MAEPMSEEITVAGQFLGRVSHSIAAIIVNTTAIPELDCFRFAKMIRISSRVSSSLVLLGSCLWCREEIALPRPT